MGIGAAPRFNAVGVTARHLSAMSSIRLLKFTSGWTITVCGTLIILSDVDTATAQLLRSVFGAIRSAMP
ncbi:hypothetical protein SAMN05446635_4271 [Burkholderia sp. OK233]|nr:hypothetical protein SAMN05446635_4271 [Burkholderia sp. OK233]